MTRQAAVVGAGVIGKSWAALMLARGWSVVVTDPSPTALASVADAVEPMLDGLDRVGSVSDGWRDRLHLTTDLAAAARDVVLVQENAPERAEVKAELLAALDQAAPDGAVVASSSSTFGPTSLAASCTRHPERVIVGHPFNPVHLVPLVEVVGSARTPEATVGRAMELYRELGKRPIHLRREVPGHLANRLQAALWREAYHLVEQGVATVADVDAAISQGPGLRWALLGPLVNQHLSGGEGGLAHVLKHLGPPTQVLMDDLGAPRLSPELAARLVAGVTDELAGHDQAHLEAERDRLLIDLLAAKSAARLPE